MKKILFSTGALMVLIGGAIAVEAYDQAGRGQGKNSDYNIETLEKVTGKTADELNVSSGQPLGEVAAEEGKLDEFHQEMIAGREERLQQAVTEGRMTQEEADQRLSQMETNFETCDGTGSMMNHQNDGTGHERGGRHMGGGRGAGSCHN